MKRLLGTGIFLLMISTLFADGSVIVLCYHTFLGKKNILYDFSPEQFSNQIESIKELGYKFVSFEEIISNNVNGNKNILLTIDDGNSSIKRIVDSVLKPNNILPILFIYPAIISHRTFVLKNQDLIDYQKEGFTIGGHGYNHMFVNQKLYDTDIKCFNREVYLSKTSLEKKLGTNIYVYAYPFGVYSSITIKHLIKAGYHYSFCLTEKPMLVPISLNADLFQLPRYMVTRNNWKGVYQYLKNNLNPPQLVKKGKKKNGKT